MTALFGLKFVPDTVNTVLGGPEVGEIDSARSPDVCDAAMTLNPMDAVCMPLVSSVADTEEGPGIASAGIGQENENPP